MNKPRQDSNKNSLVHIIDNTVLFTSKSVNFQKKQHNLQKIQCKSNILKYISLNQFGVGFNICNIFTQMSKIQTSLLNNVSDVEKQQLDHKKNVKNKYEKQFQDLLERMGKVIQDFLLFQVEFKKEYFGFNIAKPQFKLSHKKSLRSYNSPNTHHIGSQKSVSSRQSITKKLSSQQQQQEQKKQTQLQKKLRQILKKKLAPQKQNIIKFCQKGADPIKNMSKLQQKIDMMQSQIILSRTRQEKIIQIFNKRRIQNIQPKGQNLIHSQLIATDNGDNKKQNSKLSPKGQNLHLNCQQINQQKNQQKKRRNFQKPSLDFQQITCPKYREHENEPTSSSTIYGQVIIKSPKQLISPKSFKNPRQPNAQFNFFNSPKNNGFYKKMNSRSPVNFKKKKDSQNQTEQNRNSNIEIAQEEDQKNNLEKGSPLNMNNSINKNRSIFMKKRSNNQNINPGAVISTEQKQSNQELQ